MKKTASVMALIILLLGVTPFGFGFWVEQRVHEMLGQMSASTQVSHRLIRAERGWFNSTYEVVVEFTGEAAERFRHRPDGQAGDPRPLSLTLLNTVHHGPLPFITGGALPGPALAAIDTRIIAVAGEALEQEADNGIAYSILTRLDFAGGSSSHARIPPLQRRLNGGQTQIDWQGLQGELHYDPAGRRVVAEFLARALVVEDDNGRLEMGDWGMALDLTEVVEHIAVGEASFSLALLDFANKQQPDKGFHLQGLSLNSHSSAADEVLHSQADMQLQKITGDGRQFGPGSLSIALRNLDIDAVSGINRQLRQLQEQAVPQEQMGMMLGATILSKLPQILRQRPELELAGFRLDTGEGIINGSGKVSIDSSNPAVLANPMMIREAIVAEVLLQIPAPVLQTIQVLQLEKELAATGLYTAEQISSLAAARARQKVEMLVANRVLEKADGHYRFSASMSQGQVMVNGRPFATGTM